MIAIWVLERELHLLTNKSKTKYNQMQNKHHSDTHSNSHGTNIYLRLLVMGILSFIAMYILMYTMVDKMENVIPNINQIYMAGLMASPMIIIEILLMQQMYKNRRLNTIILTISAIALISFFFLIRKQGAVKDEQFLKSMIPHHAAALLMGKEAEVSDPEIKELISKIVEGQQAEIEFMKRKIDELEAKD